MSLSPDEVRHIAHLARLRIDERDVDDYAQNLSRIVDFVDQLGQADTADVTPMAHPVDMAQRLREDRVTEENHRDEYQQNAPATEAGLYLVPRVLE
ncbi:aspartyl-tRNA(Asn)/glutamyl-tRNA(Gln) amidotransferase subunit C [Natronospira proteinivora]|uniref:Aspartyl/glutamyl-tRNA(Asn/Gln) amidotransferase subunit C n=1 Tax=Natronospira proteinivora TaxID=1807133 RepID=A0ABT1G7V8_9GAMM|nr:Asp-tRNA(Asn)/Glu-tRNA(Gln) amidotransferase subunit GatC [Natronospira proteinivora]MCP1727374.1 aspartyl-tRNA(Asn)/glutamyl-tRNA(Gln) amidotransferase subunit C [Natronospira proteinivora]